MEEKNINETNVTPSEEGADTPQADINSESKEVVQEQNAANEETSAETDIDVETDVTTDGDTVIEESIPAEVETATEEEKAVEESEELEPIKEIEDIEESEKADSTEEIEEKQSDVLEPVTVVKAEPTAYAFRWDYNEQRLHDDSIKTKSVPARGVTTYVLILTVTFILAIAVLLGAIFIGNALSRPSAPMQYSDSLALDELYEYCLPSYVAISVVKNSGSEGAGSGIIITEDGYICTNYHVVENAKKITVVIEGTRKLEAEYIDGDEINDIAVVKVSANNLKAATLGNSKNTKVGERVMAIGTPFSINYAGSMTAGYVSGVDRQYAIKNDNGTVNKILKFIQTDTSVNPGNSGGPLFNMNGEVIGVVTLKIAATNYEGMGFALPIDGVKNMIFDIIENGKITDSNAGSAVRGAALGISGHELIGGQKYLITSQYCIKVQTDDNGDYIEWSTGIYNEKVYVTDTDTLDALGLEGAYPYLAPCTGILVKSTNEGFDSHEKLQINDIIISANDVVCDTMSTLQGLIFDSRVGDILKLKIHRDGMIINVEVELGVANSME